MTLAEPVGRRILLTGLHVDARIGWTAGERSVAQPLVLDLDLVLRPQPDPRAPPASPASPGSDAGAGPGAGPGADPGFDDLADTVDYAELAGRVATLVSAARRRLLETLAADVLAEILRDRRVDAATVTVHKPGAPLPVLVDDVAVVLSGRSPGGTTRQQPGDTAHRGSPDRR